MVSQTENSNGLLLEVKGISKRFPGVLALNNVSMKLYTGRILAVIGENGAGKSTLMKILAGILTPNAGKIFLNNKEVKVDSVSTATKLGIALIHQELNLSENLDVAANIFLNREPRYLGPLNLINRSKIYSDSEKILKKLGMECSPKTIVKNLPIGQRQMVEIARALSINARIFILDEPTSSLSQKETKRLFAVLKELKSQGVSIAYISHRLSEVKQIADSVTVLRDGCNSGDLTKQQISHDNMVKLMVGRDIKQFYHHRTHTASKPILEVQNLVLQHNPAVGINLTVGAGEIVCLAGLVGAGRTELARALFGIDKSISGTIKIDGNPYTINSPADALSAGMALVPEDRKLYGLILQMAVADNITLAGLNKYQYLKLIRSKQLRNVANNMVEKLDVRTPNLHQQVQYLSGGNQQKVVLAKWLSLKLRILILDEPTRGVDVVAKEEIYRLIEQLATNGMAILMISSEMEEVLAISDRIIVVHEGQITGRLTPEQFSEEKVMNLATGRTQ
ncbi:MAG: sugar ABC transporter ATP-binding protein [Planctomycetota bacterium]|jgi:ribose transport system ATP-binding protein